MPTTLNTYHPFDAGAGANVTEAQWRAMARHWLESGVIAGEDLEFEAFADATGMQVKVRTGECWIRGHFGESTSTKTLTIAAAHATLARIDRVVLRVDFTNNRVELDVLTGTAAGSPTVPALTQSTAVWEISLARVSVPAADTSIDAAQVTDEREYANRVPQVRAVRSTIMTIGNNLLSPVQFNAADTYDYTGLHDIVTNNERLVANKVGLWVVTGSAQWASTISDNDRIAAEIRVNGTTIVAYSSVIQGLADIPASNVDAQYRMAVGDYFEFMLLQVTGGNLDITKAQFAMHWVSA